MPRPNRRRDVFAEDNLAARITIEREQRGWTLDSLAKRMTDTGCPIPGSAIYKIEQGQPRRRIVVDELVAFSRVFGIPVASLLVDPAVLVTDRMVKLLERLQLEERAVDEHEEAAKRAAERGGEAVLALFALTDGTPGLQDDLVKQLKARGLGSFVEMFMEEG